MIEPSFAVFKYKHDDPVVRSGIVWAGWWALAVLTALFFFVLGPFAIIPCGIAIAFMVKKWPRKQLFLGTRYLVCGNTVAYYKNIERMSLRPGHLVLFWGNKQSFKLEETRFPTNARKPHKIKANKEAKFKKVSDKIIERVLAESPRVELNGINRKRPAEAKA